jgi:hypothetical protein
MTVETDRRITINPYNKVRFIDVYGPLVKFGGLIKIGTLAKVNELYTFDYEVNAHAMTSRTLNGLPAVHNETLDVNNWWFFKKRLPPLQRSDVIKHIEEAQLDATRPMSLLAVFGAQNIRDPRILVARL